MLPTLLETTGSCFGLLGFLTLTLVSINVREHGYKDLVSFFLGLHGYKSKINVFHTDSNRLHGIKFDCYLDARLRGSTVDFTSEQFGCRSTTASEISGGLGGAWVFSVGKATLKFLPWAMTYSVAAPVEGFRNAWFQWNDSQMFVDNTRVLIEPCDSLDM